jgi:Mce-associated membrane protein
VSSDARTRLGDEEEASVATADTGPDEAATGTRSPGAGDGPDDDGARDSRARRGRGSGDDGGDGGDGDVARSRRRSPLVPILVVLLVGLLGAAAFLWFTRPGDSQITTGDYSEALQAARSGVVDLTSFDHLTLDDDIEQARRVTTGDLREETVDRLEAQRQSILDIEAVVNTEVVAAGVLDADPDDATVMLLIESTQQSTAAEQPQILRYRIEVTLQKVDDRWLLSGITGTGAALDD